MERCSETGKISREGDFRVSEASAKGKIQGIKRSSGILVKKSAKLIGTLGATLAVGVPLFLLLLSAILGIVASRSASRILRQLRGEYVPPVVPLDKGVVIDAEYREVPPQD